MQPTTKEPTGTSFWNVTFKCTPMDLINTLPSPPLYSDNEGTDKVNFEWNLETDNGNIFTIYDWKYYRPLRPDEEIVWHIGAHNEKDSIEALNEMKMLLTFLQDK